MNGVEELEDTLEIFPISVIVVDALLELLLLTYVPPSPPALRLSIEGTLVY
jgi:hypothetical protein